MISELESGTEEEADLKKEEECTNIRDISSTYQVRKSMEEE